MVIAALVGFWQERGLAPMTIKMRLQHITQAAAFVNTSYCPKERGDKWSQAQITKTKAWYKRISAWALKEAERQPTKLYSVGLWEAWEFARKDYVAFCMELKVRACVACMLEALPPTSSHCGSHRPTTASGPLSWPGGARLWCSDWCLWGATSHPLGQGPSRCSMPTPSSRLSVAQRSASELCLECCSQPP